MKKILTSVFLGIALLLLAPQTIQAASTPFTFTAKMTQPSEGMTVKTGSTFYIFVKVAPPESGTGFKTSFIVSWPDGSSQVISSANLDLDASKVINGPVGNRPVSVFAVMTQAGNSYVATQTLTGKVNVVSGPLAITSSLPATNATLKSGAARSFSVQVAGGQAPYKVTWSFPDGKSVVANANAQGLATASWVPNGESGKKLVLIAVTDQAKKTVLKNQYIVVSTVASPAKFHDADLNKNYVIDANEIAYVVSLYNAKTGSYGCGATAGVFSPDSTNHNCTPFNGDINRNWKIDLTELTRISQLYNSGGYTVKAGTEDGFAPTGRISLDDSDDDSQDGPSLLSRVTDGISNLFSQAFGGAEPQTLVGATTLTNKAVPCSLTRYHDADVNKDCIIQFGELAYVELLSAYYNTNYYSCGNGPFDYKITKTPPTNCSTYFTPDTNKDWKVSKNEANRVINYWKAGAYTTATVNATNPDGFTILTGATTTSILITNITSNKGSVTTPPSGIWSAAYPSLGFTVVNNGNIPVYLSKDANIALATTTSSGRYASSTVTSTVVSGQTIADTTTAYVVQAGAARTFTYNYTVDNTNGTTAAKKLSIVQINYGTTPGVYNLNVNYGLENLYVQVP